MESEEREKARRVLDCYDFAFIQFFGNQYPVSAAVTQYADTHANRYHRHDHPQVWYCLDGNYTQCIDNVTYEFTPGSIVVIPPGVFHNISVPKGETPVIARLNVAYDLFADAPAGQYQNAIANLFLRRFKEELNYAFPAFRMLSQESQKKIAEHISWITALQFEHLKIDAVSALREKLEQIFSIPELVVPAEYLECVDWLSRTRLTPIMRALTYINTHYAEPIREDQLLQVSETKHTELYRSFKRFTGSTFAQYQQILRVKHAYFYLKHTAYPLSYISDVCGFYNLSHMSKLFNKYMGQTPRDFRLEYNAWIDKNPQNKPKTKVI